MTWLWVDYPPGRAGCGGTLSISHLICWNCCKQRIILVDPCANIKGCSSPRCMC
ncbi:hypothetical protein BDV35DRAFT_371054 [Aspergillus flavus]|uniref:Uncharacterized protein n=1 Tax=Aspergillus flavus TaxID=5059 RepID=A0A5N6GI01_ASPFL|nr:hypothetical protein BDV35DRAFT_371054 [Aspergillus flavus]